MNNKLKVYLPAAVSGIALVLCFPRYDLYPLAWVALVPFLVSLWGMPPARAFKTGFAMGMVYFFGTQYWIYHSMYHYGGVALPLGIAIVLLLSAYLSLYTGLFGLFFSSRIRQTSLPALLLAPLFWVTLEYLRAYAFTGFPWSSLGYSQYKFLRIIQFADITGVYGVSFLIVSVNGALADIYITRKKMEEKPLFHLSHTIMGYLTLIIILVTALVYGSKRISEVRPGDYVKISIIQGNIRQDLKWDERFKKDVMDKYEALSRKAAEQKPDMIVWPESAVPFYYGYDAPYTERLNNFQRGLGTGLLFGALTVKEDRKLANGAVLLDAGGTAVYAYDKIHLVPFGEYVPLRKILFFVDKLATGIGDYAPGKNIVRAKTPYGEFGVHICYEIIFPGLVRKFYKDGGDFIVTMTNDAWFGRTPGPYQHFAFAALRAVENRKPVIRAANTGISGFITSDGRIEKKSALFEEAVLTETIRTDRTQSVYSRYGDMLPYLCIVTVLVLIMNFRRR